MAESQRPKRGPGAFLVRSGVVVVVVFVGSRGNVYEMGGLSVADGMEMGRGPRVERESLRMIGRQAEMTPTLGSIQVHMKTCERL